MASQTQLVSETVTQGTQTAPQTSSLEKINNFVEWVSDNGLVSLKNFLPIKTEGKDAEVDGTVSKVLKTFARLSAAIALLPFALAGAGLSFLKGLVCCAKAAKDVSSEEGQKPKSDGAIENPEAQSENGDAFEALENKDNAE